MRAMTTWVNGNLFHLLENGEAFFPRIFECIAAAQDEVVLETFILFEDKVGLALHAELLQAASRGVRIDITIDGFGSPDLSPEFISALIRAGVRVHVFDPAPRLWGWRTNVFRRMHRKIVVIDGQRAFVGGINYSADHLADFGPMAKQDYAIEVQGPIVAQIHAFVHGALAEAQRTTDKSLGSHVRQRLSDRARRLTRGWRSAPGAAPAPSSAPVGDAAAIFVSRDNSLHTADIERHYRIAIRAARHRVVIANAYFFPGYRLLNEMRKAARRGVVVQLILQGVPDMPIVKIAANLLYHHLLTDGVQIFEYGERTLHAKVAVSDDEWSTVGSSNLDPLSLSLNLEANVIIKDRVFNQQLTERLERLMQHNNSQQIIAHDLPESNWWRLVRSYFVYHLLSRYPAWADWLPAHVPRMILATVSDTDAEGRGAERDGQALPRPEHCANPRAGKPGFTKKPWWPWLKRGVFTAFFALVGYLLVSQARTIEWSMVLASLQDYPLTLLLGALALATASYLLYSCFDLLGRNYTGHSLPAPTVMLLTFVSYAFNLNLGSVVGGVAFRYRLYTRLGLAMGTITRIMSFSILANWIGYLLLAGLVFSLQPPTLPANWEINTSQLRMIGFVLLALALAYLGACVISRQRSFSLGKHKIELPSFRLADLQMTMGAGNWLLMSGTMYILLLQRIDFFTVASVLLLAAIAGLITHIPGNLGVLEAVFVALLSDRMPRHELLAGLVAYRVIYYLIPLAVAAVIYLVMEAQAKRPTPSLGH
jgi:cardiolipin synthase